MSFDNKKLAKLESKYEGITALDEAHENVEFREDLLNYPDPEDTEKDLDNADNKLVEAYDLLKRLETEHPRAKAYLSAYFFSLYPTYYFNYSIQGHKAMKILDAGGSIEDAYKTLNNIHRRHNYRRVVNAIINIIKKILPANKDDDFPF